MVADPSPRVLFSAPRHPAKPDDSKNGSSPEVGRLRETGPGVFEHLSVYRSLNGKRGVQALYPKDLQ